MLLDLYLRDLSDAIRHDSLRQLWWKGRAARALHAKLKAPAYERVARHVATEKDHLIRNLAAGDTLDERRLDAAIAWLLLAHKATPDDGVSLGYFPLQAGWRVSYPETTGYIITTLVHAGRTLGRPELLQVATAMADWEISVQMDSGAVQGGPLVAREKQTPAAFNTGMVLDGLCTIYEETKQPHVIDAAGRAARFLQQEVDSEGYFRTNGQFVSGSKIKMYTCLCAWAMLRFARLTHDFEMERTAVRVVEAVVRKQKENGWYPDNCLDRVSVPLTHTIGYAAQGVLEVGLLLGREDFVTSAKRAVLGALRAQRKGFVPGRLDSEWRGAAPYVCLTGSAQLAIVAYRLVALERDAQLAQLAQSALAFVKATQRLESEDPAMVGAIAGSYPFLGGYMSAGYPNWATKYFVDAMLVEKAVSSNGLTGRDPHLVLNYPAYEADTVQRETERLPN